MNTYADKKQENKKQSVSNGESQMKSSGDSFQFVSNRPEAVGQRKLQEMANNSPQVSQLKAYQKMASGTSAPIQMVGDAGISSPKPGLARATADPHAGKKAMAEGLAEDVYETAALGAVAGGITGGVAGTFAAPGIGTGVGAVGGAGIGGAAGALAGAVKGAVLAPIRGFRAAKDAKGAADNANQAQDAQSAKDTATINTMNAIKGVIDDVRAVKTDVGSLKEEVRINKGLINLMEKGLI